MATCGAGVSLSPLSPWQGRAAELQAAGSDVHLEVWDNALLALQGSGDLAWAGTEHHRVGVSPSVGAELHPPLGPCLMDVHALPVSSPPSPDTAIPQSYLPPQVPPWHRCCRRGCRMTWPSCPS